MDGSSGRGTRFSCAGLGFSNQNTQRMDPNHSYLRLQLRGAGPTLPGSMAHAHTWHTFRAVATHINKNKYK